ncbi:MAG: HemK2/MTQ2 family protein methyltransferase [Candidatus Bathyarchaeia archaeon]|jgi:release factor glutamine methyltransferase
MPSPTKRVHFGDCIFDLTDDVYEPAEDSFLFAENLKIAAGEVVLDLGTGSGILAVLVAKKDNHVVAVDLNPYAVRCAKANAKLNSVEDRIDFLQGDLFSVFQSGAIFDVVLFNAPYLPSEEGEAASWIGRSWAGGADGRQVVDRFIAEVSSYLKPAGKVLLMQSTLTGVQETIRAFAIQGFEAHVMAEQKLPFFETLTLIEAKRLTHKEML